MKGNLAKRFGALIAVLMVTQLVALPTAHATVKGTASIAAAQRSLFSGTPLAVFDVTVTNAGLAQQALPLDQVEIVVPRVQLEIISGAVVSGWNSVISPPIPGETADKITYTSSGPQNLILPGQSKTFSITANVKRVPGDTSKIWKVGVSDTGGTSTVQQSEATAGALTTLTKVLKVLDAQIVGDAKVTDGSVTSGQTATIRSYVENAGSAPLTVTAAISGLGTAVVTPPAPQVIPAESSEFFFEFVTSFGSPGSITPTVDANAPQADGIPVTDDPITIQSPFAATYTAGSLTPTSVNPGQPYTFQMTTAKTGQVTADLDPANTTLSFGGLFTAPLVSAVSVGAGNQNVGLTFQSTMVPASLLDGAYTPTLQIQGTDSNGFPFTLTPAVGDVITLDRTLPVVLPTLTPPAPQVGSDPATSDGLTLSFGGSVFQADGVTACGGCTIQSAELIQFDATNTELAHIPVTASNSNGTIGGSYTSNYAPTATSVRLSIIAKKPNGITGTGLSSPVAIDNQDPFFVEAATGGPSGTDLKRIDITLNEAVTQSNGIAQADWTVQDNTVEDATVNGNVVTLTLGSDLAGDENPTVDYSATPVSERSEDRVSQTVADQVIDATDGILPGIPDITQIAGKAEQDGKYYVNQSAPSFLITNVAEGQTVSLFEDINSDGQIDVGDRLLARDTVGLDQDEITLTSDDLGATSRELTVLGINEDSSGNTSNGISSDALVLDFDLPEAATILVDGTTVNVGFGEPIVSGRNNTADWLVYGPSAIDGEEEAFIPTSVTGAGASRGLPLDDANFTGTVFEVTYIFVGPVGQRYVDRAGNPVTNFSITP